MKTLLQVIMIITGVALISGIIYYLQARTTADEYKIALGAGIIGTSLLPFIISLGFNKLIEMFEYKAEQRKIWLESINHNLLEIKKYLKGGEKK